MKRYLLFLLAWALGLYCNAQIGYQVSLLNKATGEPRANEPVNVVVTISDSTGSEIYKTTQTSVTNDFGVLSLTIGDHTTFANAPWDKLPFYISASVDDVLIGRSQILNVPVAEHALHTGTLTVEKLCSKQWPLPTDGVNSSEFLNFNEDGTATLTTKYPNSQYSDYIKHCEYIIDGNFIQIIFMDLIYAGYEHSYFYFFNSKKDKIYRI